MPQAHTAKISRLKPSRQTGSLNDFLEELAHRISRQKVAQHLDRHNDHELARLYFLPIDEVRSIRTARDNLFAGEPLFDQGPYSADPHSGHPKPPNTMKRSDRIKQTERRNKRIARWIKRHGASISEASAHFDLSYNLVAQICKDLKIPHARSRQVIQAKRRKIAESLRHRPMPADQAARKFDLSISTIRSIAHGAKINLPRKPYPKRRQQQPQDPALAKRNATMAAMRRKGATLGQIADLFKISKQRAGQILADFDIPTPDPTVKRRKTLAHLRKHTMTARQAAEKFDYSVNYVRNICNSAGIALINGHLMRKGHEERERRNDQIVAMRQAGESLQSISDAFELNEGYVSQILSKRGVVRRKRKSRGCP